MKKKYTCIMFDLDGTLLDTIGDIRYSINLTMKELGYPEHTNEEVRSFINFGARRLIELALPEDRRSDEEIDSTLQIYLGHYSENVCIETEAYEGTQELIKKLKEEGYLLSVVSNKPEKMVSELCEMFFGKNTFAYVSGTGGGKPTKPDRACIDLALQSMGADADGLLYVGDSLVDVKTAHNAGAPCVGVTWGFHGKDGFCDEIPDFYAHDADMLYDIIHGKNTGE